MPRWFAGPAGGLEDAAGAAIAFVLLGGVGALLSLFLVVRTLVGFARLSWPARVAGTLPAGFAGWLAWYVWRAL
ncbi:MAG: hypothetical protein R2752_08390 [Vicinamibacterales bacterium]